MGKLNTVQNGKGSKKRPTDIKKFIDNFDDINWTRKETSNNNNNEKHTDNSPTAATETESQS